MSRTPSRRTSARAWPSHLGASENAHGRHRAPRSGSQNVWSAESPPTRRISGPSPRTRTRDRARSSSGICPDHSGSAQYSVESPRYERGTAVRAASAATDTTAETGAGARRRCRAWRAAAEDEGAGVAPPQAADREGHAGDGHTAGGRPGDRGRRGDARAPRRSLVALHCDEYPSAHERRAVTSNRPVNVAAMGGNPTLTVV